MTLSLILHLSWWNTHANKPIFVWFLSSQELNCIKFISLKQWQDQRWSGIRVWWHKPGVNLHRLLLLDGRLIKLDITHYFNFLDLHSVKSFCNIFYRQTAKFVTPMAHTSIVHGNPNRPWQHMMSIVWPHLHLYCRAPPSSWLHIITNNTNRVHYGTLT